MSSSREEKLNALSTFVFNESMTKYISSFLPFPDLLRFIFTSKQIRKYLKDKKFLKEYYVNILKHKPFVNSSCIDYEFEMFNKEIYKPRIKIINKLKIRLSYYWFAVNRKCMKCGNVSYPEKLNERRLKRLMDIQHTPICFCENTVTNTLMGNEEEKLENDLKILQWKKRNLENKIKKKKEQINYHKNTYNLKNFEKYLINKQKTLQHGRQINQCFKMVDMLDLDHFERYNPQYDYVKEGIVRFVR